MTTQYKKARKKLESVSRLRQRLLNYERLRDREISKQAPKDITGIDLSRPSVSSSKPEPDLLAIAEAIAYYESRITATKEEINDIKIVVSQLSKQYSQVIELFYFEGKHINQIASELHIEPRSAYNRRKKATIEFGEIYPW